MRLLVFVRSAERVRKTGCAKNLAGVCAVLRFDPQRNMSRVPTPFKSLATYQIVQGVGLGLQNPCPLRGPRNVSFGRMKSIAVASEQNKPLSPPKQLSNAATGSVPPMISGCSLDL